MSIIIKGMKMPKNCWDCPLVNTSPCACKGYSTAIEHTKNRHPDCPLVELPPHGRLIDGDALNDECVPEPTFSAEMLFRKLNNAPTIIEAEGVKE